VKLRVESRGGRAPGGSPVELEAGRYGRELIIVLGRLMDLHTLLAELVESKIERMRRCDVTGLSECVRDEQELAGKIGETEGLRRALTDRIGRSYGMSSPKARKLTATQLAERFPPPQRDELLDLARRLQELAMRITRRNQVAARISGAMLTHLDTVLSAMTVGGAEPGAYSQRGRRLEAEPKRLFETVG